MYMCVRAHSCPTLCDPMDYSPPGFSVHGISQARILEWVAISFPYIYIYIYMCVCVCVCVCIWRDRMTYSTWIDWGSRFLGLENMFPLNIYQHILLYNTAYITIASPGFVIFEKRPNKIRREILLNLHLIFWFHGYNSHCCWFRKLAFPLVPSATFK